MVLWITHLPSLLKLTLDSSNGCCCNCLIFLSLKQILSLVSFVCIFTPPFVVRIITAIITHCRIISHPPPATTSCHHFHPAIFLQLSHRSSPKTSAPQPKHLSIFSIRQHLRIFVKGRSNFVAKACKGSKVNFLHPLKLQNSCCRSSLS